MANYRIIIQGIQLGKTPQQVIPPLSRCLKISPAKAAFLLEKKAVILKQTDQAKLAQSYQSALQQTGVVCYVQADTAKPPPQLMVVESAPELKPSILIKKLKLLLFLSLLSAMLYWFVAPFIAPAALAQAPSIRPEPLGKIYTIGQTDIFIPYPEGYVPISTNPPVSSLFTLKRLATYTPAATQQDSLRGMLVETSLLDSYSQISSAEFAQLCQDLQQNDLHSLAPPIYAENSLIYSLKNQNRAGTKILLNVSGKLLSLEVFAITTDLVWSQTIAQQWAATILQYNPAPPIKTTDSRLKNIKAWFKH